MSDYTPLSAIAKEFELKPGDMVYLAADITRLVHTARKHNERFDPVEFLNSFTSVIGSEGTLLIPAFNHTLRKNEAFDKTNTQPITGILAQYALRSPGFQRTYNALHSFAVWGKHRQAICALRNESSFSEDSPFAYMHQHNAIMITIDLDLQSSLTFAHYTEEQENVKYRSWKRIPVQYTDEAGNTERKSFRLFAKKAGYINNVNPLEELFMSAGILQMKTINNIPCTRLELGKAHEIMLEDIRNNKAKNIVYFNTKQWAKSMVKTAMGKK
jgi:aminoglycoside 3-N-acetyltransferase